MAEKIVVYMRENGQFKYTYGPKQFNADWGGAFTALEIANLVTKLPKVSIGKRTPMKIRSAGRAVEKVNLQMWMERLEMVLISLNLDSLMINVTKTKWLNVDKILPSHSIWFSGKNQRPSMLVGQALCDMKLNYWGVIQELTVAMSEFDSLTTTGKLSASVFFTI